jgi:glycosyltransferase involved in cell wall biosynthesis
MPEILILCEYATMNGGERSMATTLDPVRAAGFSPVVAAPREGPLADALAARNMEHLPFDCQADGHRVPQAKLREQLATMLEHRRPALLHANSLAMGRLSGPVAARLELPSIAHLRDIIKLNRQAAADLNCHRRLLAVSNAVREYHISGGLSADKTYVLYNGVDLNEFRPRTPTGFLHRGLGLLKEGSSDVPLIATVGQIGLRKGQDVLLRAAAMLFERWPNVHYLVIGERHSQKEESRRFEGDLHRAAEQSLPGRVHFLGRRDDMAAILSEVTLLVHPARQEPLGRVLLEAAASGTAVVAADVGGTREIFPPERDAARIVPPNDAEQLAATISELLADGELRTRLGNAARQCGAERFDIRKTATALVRHYEALLQRP